MISLQLHARSVLHLICLLVLLLGSSCFDATSASTSPTSIVNTNQRRRTLENLMKDCEDGLGSREVVTRDMFAELCSTAAVIEILEKHVKGVDYDASRLWEVVLDEQGMFRENYDDFLLPWNDLPQKSFNQFLKFSCKYVDAGNNETITYCNSESQRLRDMPESTSVPLGQLNNVKSGKVASKMCENVVNSWDSILASMVKFYVKRELVVQLDVTDEEQELVTEPDESNNDVADFTEEPAQEQNFGGANEVETMSDTINNNVAEPAVGTAPELNSEGVKEVETMSDEINNNVAEPADETAQELNSAGANEVETMFGDSNNNVAEPAVGTAPELNSEGVNEVDTRSDESNTNLAEIAKDTNQEHNSEGAEEAMSAETVGGGRPVSSLAASESEPEKKEMEGKIPIIFGAVGGFVGLCAIVATVFLLKRRRSKKIENNTRDLEFPEPEPEPEREFKDDEPSTWIVHGASYSDVSIEERNLGSSTFKEKFETVLTSNSEDMII